MKVRTQTNLVKRGSVWYFRKKVPADLRDHYGQESIRKSLGGFPALADARKEAAKLAAQYDAEFEAVRQSLRPAKATPLTQAMIPAISKALEGHILAADEEVRTQGMSEEDFAQWEAETAATVAEVSRAYARGDSSPIDAALEDWLYGLGIDAAPESAEFKALRREFLKARLKALQGKAARDRGDIIETPETTTVEDLREAIKAEGQGSAQAVTPSAPKVSSKGGPRLSSVVNYWKGVGAKTERTMATADSVVKAFTDLHGDIPLMDITKAHFVALRDDLLARVKPATVQTRFNLLKAAFTVCLEDDQLGIRENPLQYVKIRNQEEGKEDRDAFTVDQLQALFDSPVLTIIQN